jgi:hypothetical protein
MKAPGAGQWRRSPVFETAAKELSAEQAIAEARASRRELFKLDCEHDQDDLREGPARRLECAECGAALAMVPRG